MHANVATLALCYSSPSNIGFLDTNFYSFLAFMCMIGKCWAKLRHKIILVQDMSIVVGNHNMVWPLYVHATRVLKTSQNNDLVVNNAHKLL